jgi:hypothetical protein
MSGARSKTHASTQTRSRRDFALCSNRRVTTKAGAVLLNIRPVTQQFSAADVVRHDLLPSNRTKEQRRSFLAWLLDQQEKDVFNTFRVDHIGSPTPMSDLLLPWLLGFLYQLPQRPALPL